MLNPKGSPMFEAVAPKGTGVFDTLKAVAKLVLTDKLIAATKPLDMSGAEQIEEFTEQEEKVQD